MLTLLENYLVDDINIFLRRNYSQSNLAYQQFFIVEPSRQIDQVLAPKKISNTFFNYFIKQAVTGGLCTSFVHGNIDNTTVINEHFNYLENPCLNPEKWPNFNNLKQWNKAFSNTPSGIKTIDIRSLYPSATVKKLPVNSLYSSPDAPYMMLKTYSKRQKLQKYMFKVSVKMYEKMVILKLIFFN